MFSGWRSEGTGTATRPARAVPPTPWPRLERQSPTPFGPGRIQQELQPQHGGKNFKADARHERPLMESATVPSAPRGASAVLMALSADHRRFARALRYLLRTQRPPRGCGVSESGPGEGVLASTRRG